MSLNPQLFFRAPIISIILIIMMVCPVLAGRMMGFADISFGLKDKEVVQALIKRYEFVKSTTDPGYYLNPKGYRMKVGLIIKIQNFQLGKDYYDVIFNFNQNRKFCHFQFEGEKYGSDDFDEMVMDDVKFLSKVFTKKIGPPYNKHWIRLHEVKEGFNTVHWTWKRKGQDIYTGVGRKGLKYYARAVVVDKPLLSEPLEFHQEVEDKTVDEAAEAF